MENFPLEDQVEKEEVKFFAPEIEGPKRAPCRFANKWEKGYDAPEVMAWD